MNRKFVVAITIFFVLLLAGSLFLVINAGNKVQGQGGSKSVASTVDSGVAACQQIVENAKTPSTGDHTKMTDAQRKETRAPFEKSKYADIQTAGTSFVDTLYKVDNLDLDKKSDDASLEAAGEQLGTAMGATMLVSTQYGLLKSACAAHGVDLPTL